MKITDVQASVIGRQSGLARNRKRIIIVILQIMRRFFD